MILIDQTWFETSLIVISDRNKSASVKKKSAVEGTIKSPPSPTPKKWKKGAGKGTIDSPPPQKEEQKGAEEGTTYCTQIVFSHIVLT